MLTYEQITTSLIQSLQNVGLKPYLINNKVEIATLEKEFRCNCVPNYTNPPYSTRAQLSFSWDSKMTAESIYGGNCSLYHDETEECNRYEVEAVPFIELQIDYHINVEEGFRLNTDVINNELLTIFKRNLGHKNIPGIKWELIINAQGKNVITSISAHHYWQIDFSDEPIEFEDILIEVKDNLESIQKLPFIKKN